MAPAALATLPSPAAASHGFRSAVESPELHGQPAHGHSAGAAACVSQSVPALFSAPLASLSFAAALTNCYLTCRFSYRGEGKVGVNRDDMRETLAKRMYATAAAVLWFWRAARVCSATQNKIREFGGQLPSEILKQAGRKPAASKAKPAEPDEFDRTIEEVRAHASCRRRVGR